MESIIVSVPPLVFSVSMCLKETKLANLFARWLVSDVERGVQIPPTHMHIHPTRTHIHTYGHIRTLQTILLRVLLSYA